MKASTVDIKLTHPSLANLFLSPVLQHFQKKVKVKNKKPQKTTDFSYKASRIITGEAVREALQPLQECILLLGCSPGNSAGFGQQHTKLLLEGVTNSSCSP